MSAKASEPSLSSLNAATPRRISLFLDLPVELRMLIYSFALCTHPIITVSTTELRGGQHDIVHRLYGNERSPCPSLLENHEPVIVPQYDAGLLSIVRKASLDATVPLRDGVGLDMPRTLMLVNKLVHGELRAYLKLTQNRPTSLFISYPQGLHVLATLAPHLVLQTRSVHLAGVYVVNDISSRLEATRYQRGNTSSGKQYDCLFYNSKIRSTNSGQLAAMVLSFFGPNPTHKIAKFEMRIYYPGVDAYNMVWSDERSPIRIALQNIHAGESKHYVWRGESGTGVLLSIVQSESRMTATTKFKKLEEGWHGGSRAGSWVVDPDWPEWKPGVDMVHEDWQ